MVDIISQLAFGFFRHILGGWIWMDGWIVAVFQCCKFEVSQGSGSRFCVCLYC